MAEASAKREWLVMNRKGPWEGYEAETNRCEVEVVFNETRKPTGGFWWKRDLGLVSVRRCICLFTFKIWETIILSANKTTSLFLRSNKPFLRRTVVRFKMKFDFQFCLGPWDPFFFFTEWTPYLPGCVTAYAVVWSFAPLCACNT